MTANVQMRLWIPVTVEVNVNLHGDIVDGSMVVRAVSAGEATNLPDVGAREALEYLSNVYSVSYDAAVVTDAAGQEVSDTIKQVDLNRVLADAKYPVNLGD